MNLTAALVTVGVIFAAGIAADRFTPIIGANARIAHFKHERDGWYRNAKAWEAYGRAEQAAFRESERLRGVEQRRAVTALDEASKACSARVARARASAAAIRTIVTKEVPHDAQGCPVRELVDAGELRNALRPATR